MIKCGQALNRLIQDLASCGQNLDSPIEAVLSVANGRADARTPSESFSSPGGLEDATMRFSCSLLIAAAVVAIGTSSVRADEFAVTSDGMSGAGAVSAPTYSLQGSPTIDGETIEVFYGRWRPYWRGYYHGSAGYSPRPHFFYGPVVYPRYYAYQPLFRPSYANGYAYASPCLGGFAVATAAPVSTNANPIVISPLAPSIATETGLRIESGPANLAPPFDGQLPPQTIEPPLALDLKQQTATKPLTNYVKGAPTQTPAGYVAYGESFKPARSKTLLVKNKK